MAEAPTSFCTICQEDDISKTASNWCFECEDFLCLECSRVHSRPRSSKDHKVTTIEDYQNLPQLVLDIKNRCSDHGEKCEFYCSFHGNACCIKCLQESHKECRELKPVREVLENFKSSAAVSHLEQDLQNIEENFSKVATYLKSRREKNQEQASGILKEIQRIRGEVNHHFDKIEQKIVDELESEQKNIDGKLEKITHQIEDKKQTMMAIRKDFSKMKCHATELQAYIGLKHFESITNKEATFVADLVDNEPDMHETYIDMEVSQALKTLVNDIASFGKIVVRSSKCTITDDINAYREQTAQLLVQTPLSIHQVNLRKKFTLQKLGEQIYGCVILPDGKMVFADCTNKCLLLYKRDGDFIGQTKLPSYPGSCININNQVAVSLPELCKILLVDVNEGKTIQEIKVDGECWDIHAEDQKLFVRLNRLETVHVLDLDRGAKVTQTITIPGHYLLNISVFSGIIYCTNWKENTVCCYTVEGELMWSFKHENLRQPRGITLDSAGFIYVACTGSNKLVMISPDGKDNRVLLGEKDGLVSPQAIDINRKLSLLVIGSEHKALVYQL